MDFMPPPTVCVCVCVSQVLDDITLGNLDVLHHRGHLAGSLLERLDHCSTPFGESFRTLFRTLSSGHG